MDTQIKDKDYQKGEINQLHNATMEFNRNSLELKKIYISLYPAVVTLSYVFMTIKDNTGWRLSLFAFTIILTIGVWFLDSYYYYYQRKLRFMMDIIKNELYNIHKSPTKYSVKGSLFNPSQLIYVYFIIISFASFMLSIVLS